MKTNEPDKHDEALHSVLHEWRMEASLPPRFQEKVWQHIERAQASNVPSVWAVIIHWIGTVLPRPALAASYMALLIVIGLTAGWSQGHRENARVKDELSQRYVRVLDPYQTPPQVNP